MRAHRCSRGGMRTAVPAAQSSRASAFSTMTRAAPPCLGGHSMPAPLITCAHMGIGSAFHEELQLAICSCMMVCTGYPKQRTENALHSWCCSAGWAEIRSARTRATAQTLCSCCCPTGLALPSPCRKASMHALLSCVSPCYLPTPDAASVSKGAYALLLIEAAHDPFCGASCLSNSRLSARSMQVTSFSHATRHPPAPARSLTWRTGSFAGASPHRSLRLHKVIQCIMHNAVS